MKYDLLNKEDIRAFNGKVDYCLLKGKKVDLTVPRTGNQNSSLHLFFTMIAEQLNELGQEFCFTGITGKELSIPYTDVVVKHMFWKPIQKTMFDIDSTTKLDTSQLNQIINVFIKFFGDKGIIVEFPSEESYNKNNFDN